MTNAPNDLLSLRSRIQTRTGLSAVEVGIVGDVAHGGRGYHEGRSDLTRVGVLNTDYSVRLARDRAGLTESASAMDIGAAWRTGGSAAWLRFNHLLMMELTGGRGELSAIRAVNYSPDGRQKLRQDRENGWRVEATSDTVDVHTHIEFYRDTEGRRQTCIDYLDSLVAMAISGQQPNGDNDMDFNQDAKMNALVDLKEVMRLDTDAVADGRGALADFPVAFSKAIKSAVADLAELKARPQVTVDAAALAAALIATPGFLTAIAKAVNDDAAERLKN